MTALEPADNVVGDLESFAAVTPQVTVLRQTLAQAGGLRAGDFDAVLYLNVLEHIEDDAAAVEAMAAALKPDGRLCLLVPAHPRLFGALDRHYGHHRRYEREGLGALISGAGLELEDLYPFNLLGVAGWWVKNRRDDGSIGAGSLRAYEALLRLWRPIEDRLELPAGLSLIARASRPGR